MSFDVVFSSCVLVCQHINSLAEERLRCVATTGVVETARG